MKTILKNIAVPAGVGRSTEALPGETVILKAVSTDTDVAYTLVEVIDEPQSGPPLHIHSFSSVRNVGVVTTSIFGGIIPLVRGS